MTPDLQRILSSKRARRNKTANLPPSEKLRLLDKLRIRVKTERGSRRTAAAPASPLSENARSRLVIQGRNNKNRPKPRNGARRFGGRATAGGVIYEVHVAAFLAVKMLSGNKCSAFEGVSGGDLSAITLQAPDHVDDVVLELRGDSESRIFISAKRRGASIALTKKSLAFTDTVRAFLRQFLELSLSARAKCRFIWVVPSSAGQAASHHLALALDAHRKDAGDDSLHAFILRRASSEKKAIESLISQAKTEWKKAVMEPIAEEELRDLLRLVHIEVYDFGPGARLEREAEGEIRTHIAADPMQASRIWQKLETIFKDADQCGTRVTAASLRQALAADGLELKSPPDFADDIAKLHELTTRNLSRLKEHSILRFGSKTTDATNIPRPAELSALTNAVNSTHLLITGEPGCGKSGLIHGLVEKLREEKVPVVLLLAEEVFSRDWKGAANLPGFAHPLDQVLANWPNGGRGILITDALDAVREPETQKFLRSLLRDVKERTSGWTVAVSVREFDLKHSGQLREEFPGSGVEGYASNDFADVAHFHLSRLSESQLDYLTSKRPDIQPFIESARKSSKSEGIHRSPFYLRLAAELLRAKVRPARLADWNSPALLMRKFWEAQIQEGAGSEEREVALKSICQRMVDVRSMTVSATELSLGVIERKAIRELRSRGILKGQTISHGTNPAEDEIAFTHHLLHDYAIARSLVPKVPARFCAFAVDHPLLPIFYRQSFLFALEELWDADEQRKGFWTSALHLEGVTSLHGISRILAPLLAARRVQSVDDLKPLLMAVTRSNEVDAPSQKALQHLASGLQDADEAAVQAGATAWCEFAEQLAKSLLEKPWLESPLVQIVARLNSVLIANALHQKQSLNNAGRALLSRHVTREVSQGSSYAARVGTEAVCRTFEEAPAEAERVLLSLLAPQRLSKFPCGDLRYLAENLHYLGPGGRAVVLRLFESAFGAEPERNQWEDRGSAIMSLRFQTSDMWRSIHHSLAKYFETLTDGDAALLTEAACIAWNAVVRRKRARREIEEIVLATISFRNVSCDLSEDYSHISGRQFEHDENRIVSHYDKLLRQWAEKGEITRLNIALDRFARRNHTSLMWSVFMEAGAAFPATLGGLLSDILDEPIFLTHHDYAYAGTELLRALHESGDTAQRKRLERLVLDLPKNARLHKDEPREPIPAWVEHAQNRLIGALKDSNIVLDDLRNLFQERQVADALAENRRRAESQVSFRTVTDEERIEREGIDLKDPANKEMLRLKKALEPFLDRGDKKFTPAEFALHWNVILESERSLARHRRKLPKMANELWGYLVGACESIVCQAEWPPASERWPTIRRIMLKAARDPIPSASDDEEDRWPTWGWPSPRVDAACGLPWLVFRLKRTDRAITAALRRLVRDKSHPVRFNIARSVAQLEESAPKIMNELIDVFIAREKQFSVLDAILRSRNGAWSRTTDEVLPRLKLIAHRALEHASVGNEIHKTIARIYLFRFLRNGDPESKEYVQGLIAECDNVRSSPVLASLLHDCREGGWLTAGNAESSDPTTNEAQSRTWEFFSDLLSTVQSRLKTHREAWTHLNNQEKREADASKVVVQGSLERATHLVDGIAMQLYFASGAADERNQKAENQLTPLQLRRFWREASPLLTALAIEIHPHTIDYLIKTFYHLLPCSPPEVFLLAAKSIHSGTMVGFQHESLAVGDVVKLCQRALADHREMFQSNSECLGVLLEVLDLFVEAGWPEARQLTHRLEEIYR